MEGKQNDDEIIKIMKNNEYFIGSPSLVSSKYVDLKKKKKIFEFLTILVQMKIITKGNEGDEVIEKVIKIAKKFEDSENEVGNKVFNNLQDEVGVFLRKVRRGGWKTSG